MSERAYTVAELDALRQAVWQRCVFGTTRIQAGITVSSRSWSTGELDKRVEETVRTHMLAGHTAQDIYDADKERT